MIQLYAFLAIFLPAIFVSWIFWRRKKHDEILENYVGISGDTHIKINDIFLRFPSYARSKNVDFSREEASRAAVTIGGPERISRDGLGLTARQIEIMNEFEKLIELYDGVNNIPKGCFVPWQKQL